MDLLLSLVGIACLLFTIYSLITGLYAEVRETSLTERINLVRAAEGKYQTAKLSAKLFGALFLELIAIIGIAVVLVSIVVSFVQKLFT